VFRVDGRVNTSSDEMMNESDSVAAMYAFTSTSDDGCIDVRSLTASSAVAGAASAGGRVWRYSSRATV